ncbi:hypothetical protein [Streptacidiphilus rugosus]|uniref:hypothetical protein n=1 Tax=Streptacidiphilus rugosus TaxID=405783 RepID=UPI00055D45C4|nr:hypothetical protein [Streptacidiphilus rugosus]
MSKRPLLIFCGYVAVIIVIAKLPGWLSHHVFWLLAACLGTVWLVGETVRWVRRRGASTKAEQGPEGRS